MNSAAEEEKERDQNNFDFLKSFDDNLDVFTNISADICSKVSDSSIPDIVLENSKTAFKIASDNAKNSITKMDNAKTHFLISLKQINK